MEKDLLPQYERRLDRVIQFLRNCDINAVESDTGVSKWTLLKIRQRQIKVPSLESIDKLYSYARKH